MLTYRVDAERRLVLVTCIGKMTMPELLTFQDGQRADPAVDPTFSRLVDCRAADFSGLGAFQIRRVMENASTAPTALRAFVVSGNLTFGLFRIYQTYSELAGRGERLEIFRDFDAAMTWIEGQQRLRA